MENYVTATFEKSPSLNFSFLKC